MGKSEIKRDELPAPLIRPRRYRRVEWSLPLPLYEDIEKLHKLWCENDSTTPKSEEEFCWAILFKGVQAMGAALNQKVKEERRVTPAAFVPPQLIKDSEAVEEMRG